MAFLGGWKEEEEEEVGGLAVKLLVWEEEKPWVEVGADKEVGSDSGLGWVWDWGRRETSRWRRRVPRGGESRKGRKPVPTFGW
jgi:hypothetical protein